MKALLPLLMLLAAPLQAQTTSGWVGDTLTVRRVMPPLGPGCYRDVLLGQSGAFLTRDTLCWIVRPTVPPPVVVDTPKPPIVVVPGRPAPLFEADWATALGSGQAALRDLSKPLPFDQCEGQIAGVGGDILHIVPAASINRNDSFPKNDFPARMVNILRVKRYNVDSWAFCRIGANAGVLVPHWPVLAVGKAFYWRVYLRVDIPNSEGDISLSLFSHHPIQAPHNTGSWEPVNFFSNADGTMDWEAYTLPFSNSFPWDKAVLGQYVGGNQYGQTLPKFTTLRFEWMVRRDTQSGYSFAFRIYDNQDRLMWSEDGAGASKGTVMNERAGGQASLKSHDGLYAADLTVFQSLSIGENGGFYGYKQPVYFYFGGLKLCADTWCGPY